MTASSPDTLASPAAVEPGTRHLPAKPAIPLLGRLVITAGLIFAYYWQRHAVIAWLGRFYTSLTGEVARPELIGIGVVAVMILCLVLIWRKVLAKDKRFHAPLLITCILIMGDAAFSILENHPSTWLARLTDGLLTNYSPTFAAITAAVVTELILGRYYYGKWPHLASAYVSGISAGILVKSPDLWPFIFCASLSITSKYVLRIGDKHLWNPTNFGLTVMLALAPLHVAPLSVQAGNEIWSVVIIWILGGIILWQLKRLHIPVAFLMAFVPLAILRSYYTGNSWLTEIAPITSTMFQLYIFFMITDPKTTTRSKWSQCLVAVLIAVVETVLRLAFRDIHSLLHALFIVGPVANLIEMAWMRHTKGARPAPRSSATAIAAAP